MQYIALEKLINLFDGYRQVFVVNHHQVLLIQEEGRRYAIQAQCPHRQWPLQHADIQRDQLICSQHGWVFDLASGRAASQRTQAHLGCYRISYQDNTIGIILGE